jgi:hypothetical protein
VRWGGRGRKRERGGGGVVTLCGKGGQGHTVTLCGKGGQGHTVAALARHPLLVRLFLVLALLWRLALSCYISTPYFRSPAHEARRL